MRRLLATALLDIRLQLRNGFYYASAFVAVVLIIMLKQLPQIDWARWWPAIILENLVVNAFYFMAGMVLLEKREGTLEVQVITPLRSWEYLVAKVLTLGLLSSLETLAVVVFVSGVAFNWLLLILGVLLLVATYSLYGFWVVARYDSISEFILPSVMWTIGFSLPLLYYFDLWESWLLFLHPLQGPLVLMQAAFEALPAWQIAYGVLYAMLWAGVAYVFGRRAFHQFAVTKEGVRSG
jgi:fluoroquinolone transport system permease protein